MMKKKNIILFIILVIFLFLPPCFGQYQITKSELEDKMKGMWLGQLIGNYAGRPYEGQNSGIEPLPDPCFAWNQILKKRAAELPAQPGHVQLGLAGDQTLALF